MYRSPAIIYNLFGRLVGTFAQWAEWLPHIQSMGFTWVYVNPFHLPGHSGSLYAVKDYYQYHPMFIGDHRHQSYAEMRFHGDAALHHFLDRAHALGLKVMMDLVINHTATDSPLVRIHPEWYQWKRPGHIKHPGAKDGRRRVTWGDLAQLDHRDRPQTRPLKHYLKDMVCHYVRLGFDGFRCDAAYKVPTHTWKPILSAARKVRHDVVFMAETLGCSAHQVVRVQRAGFDWVMNNFKWWNLQDRGFLSSYNRFAQHVASVSFPETHDTKRLALEVGGSRAICLQRYVLSAFFTSGVLMPLGFEFGAKRKPDVIRSQPGGLEKPHFDLREDIAIVNRLKTSEQIMQIDAPLHWLDVGEGICAFLKDFGGRRLVVVAHIFGPAHRVKIPGSVLGHQARVVYGLRQLEHGSLMADIVAGEVFASVGEIG